MTTPLNEAEWERRQRENHLNQIAEDELGAAEPAEAPSMSAKVRSLRAVPAEEEHAVPDAAARTDLGNAQHFAAEHSGQLRHIRERRMWLAWDGRRWRRDATGDADRAAKQTARKLLIAAASAPEEECKAAIKWALATQSEGRLRAMLDRKSVV